MDSIFIKFPFTIDSGFSFICFNMYFFFKLRSRAFPAWINSAASRPPGVFAGNVPAKFEGK